LVSSHEKSHFNFRLAYLAGLFQQLNKVNLKLQRRGRTFVDFIDKLSAFVEKRDIGSENLKQEILLFENLVTAAGDEVNVDIASEVVQNLGGLCHRRNQGGQ